MFFRPGMYLSDPVALQSSNEANRSAQQARSATESLSKDVERLLMITEALWTFLKEEHGYTDEQLKDRITEIDLRDGKLDGKVSREAAKECPKCSRALNKRHFKCIYCGTDVLPDPFHR